MRINEISSQNFNGKLIYVSKDGKKHVSSLSRRLPHSYQSFKNSVKELLIAEPFDVFISRGKTPLHFNIQTAQADIKTTPRVVELIPNDLKIYSPTSYYKNVEDLENSIYKSIDDFKIGKFEK